MQNDVLVVFPITWSNYCVLVSIRVISEVFLSIWLCISIYMSHLRRILCVDRTHLTRKYFYTTFVAYTCDDIFAITFAVVELENVVTRLSFHSAAERIAEIELDIVIISDIQKGPLDATTFVFRNSHHNY